ncbi:PEP-CTERM putative exosortase interaction domain-containing protein [Opitutaceae bacterium TAV1]|nr:PEP-CTERM putative exosortase interaction domain-containing protein [Opitutaceae bacterium TAV1]
MKMKTAKTKTTGPLRRACLAPGASGTLAFALLALAAPHARASVLITSDGATGAYLGQSASASGGGVLTGADQGDGNAVGSGTAYYYQGLDSAVSSGTKVVIEDVKLLASDGAAGDRFGFSVSLSGDSALVGANYYDGDKGDDSGSAYYFKGLDSAISSGTKMVTESVKLLASDGTADDRFGFSVSLSGDSALIAAYSGDGNEANSGAAYYYQGLDSAVLAGTKVVTEDVKLQASDGALNDDFGRSVSLSGDRALVGAWADEDDSLGPNTNTGSAYYFKGLDSAISSGTKMVTESVKLQASDGAAGDQFGSSVSLEGDRALVAANLGDGNVANTGAAYYFKGLDGKSSPVNQDVKLQASDGAVGDFFGTSASLSGDRALVGAYGDGDTYTGAAYYFKGLDGKSDTVTEDVKLLASDGTATDQFGKSVSLSGDRFVIEANSGKAYAGDIRAFTTLDAGSTVLATDGLSFVSQGDWVIGETTSNNQVWLSRSAVTGIKDTANVTATGAAVYIGKNASANNNLLFIEGELTANAVYVGTAANSGNALLLRTTGLVTADEVTITANSGIAFELGATGVNGLVAAGEIVFDGGLILMSGEGFAAFAGAEWDLFDFITGSGTFAGIDTNGTVLGDGLEWNFDRLYSDGIVSIVGAAVPEPASYAALAALAILAWVALRRSRR